MKKFVIKKGPQGYYIAWPRPPKTVRQFLAELSESGRMKILILSILLVGCAHRHHDTECQIFELTKMVKDLHIIMDIELSPTAKKALLEMDKIIHDRESKKYGCSVEDSEE